MANSEDWVWRYSFEFEGFDQIAKAEKKIQDLYKAAGKDYSSVSKSNASKLTGAAAGRMDELKNGFDKLSDSAYGYAQSLEFIKRVENAVTDSGKEVNRVLGEQLTQNLAAIEQKMSAIPAALVKTASGDTINGWAVQARALGSEINRDIESVRKLGDTVTASDTTAELLKRSKSLAKERMRLQRNMSIEIAANERMSDTKLSANSDSYDILKQRRDILEEVHDQLVQAATDEDKIGYSAAYVEQRIKEIDAELQGAGRSEDKLYDVWQNIQNDVSATPKQIEAAKNAWYEQYLVVTGLSERMNGLLQLQDAFQGKTTLAKALEETEKELAITTGKMARIRDATENIVSEQMPADMSKRFNTMFVQLNHVKLEEMDVADELRNIMENGELTNINDVSQQIASRFSVIAEKSGELTETIASANAEAERLQDSAMGGSLGIYAARDNAQRLADEFNKNLGIAEELKEYLESISFPEGQLSDDALRMQQSLLKVAAAKKEMEITYAPTEPFVNLSKAIADGEARLAALNKKLAELDAPGVQATTGQLAHLRAAIADVNKELDFNRALQQGMMNNGTAFAPEAEVNPEKYAKVSEKYAEIAKQFGDLLAKEVEASQDRLIQAAEKARLAAEKEAQRAARASEREAQRAAQAAEREAARAAMAAEREAERASKQIKQALVEGARAGGQAFANNIHKRWSRFTKMLKTIHKLFQKISKENANSDNIAKSMFHTFTKLWSMLKTRAKRKLVGVIFENVMETVNQIAQMSPRFNQAMSGFMVSARTLGAQIIAAFEPLASVVLPILSQFLDYLTKGASLMAQFFSELTGNMKFIQATKGQLDYAKSVDKTTSSTKKATKAAKDYKNTIMSFDELHTLNGTDNDDEGLLGVNLDYANNEAGYLQTLGDKLWEAFNAHDWKTIGQLLGKAVSDGFGWLSGKVGWSANADQFTEWCQGIIDGINGFVDGLEPDQIGKSIGDIGNTLINVLDIFTSGFHYEDFGKKMGETFIHAAQTIDWATLGHALMSGIQGLIKGLNAFLTAEIEDEYGNVHTVFESFGTAISETLSAMVAEIDPEVWGSFGANLFNSLLRLIGNLFGDGSRAGEFGRKLGLAVNSFFQNINSEDVAAGFNGITSAIINLFSSFILAVDWKAVRDKIKTMFKGVDTSKLIVAASIVFIPAILRGLASFFAKLGKVISAILPKMGGKFGTFVQKIAGFFKKGKGGGLTDALGKGVNFLEGLKKVGLRFIKATAFLAVLAEVGLVIMEYVKVVKEIASIDLGEDFYPKLLAVLAVLGTGVILTAIITALSTMVTKGGSGGQLLAGELLAAGFIAELYAMAKVIEEYTTVVKEIASIQLGENYEENLRKVLFVAGLSALLIGILTAVGAICTGTGVGGAVLLAGELLAAGFLAELYAMAKIIEEYVTVVQQIADLNVDDAKFDDNLKRIEKTISEFGWLMTGEGLKSLAKIPGEITSAIDIAIIREAMDAISSLTEIELPSPEKITQFKQTTEELLDMFDNKKGFFQSIWDGIKGVAAGWADAVDWSDMLAKFNIMCQMIEALVGLSTAGGSTTSLEGNWNTTMSLLEQETQRSMESIVTIISNSLKRIGQMFQGTKYAIQITANGVAQMNGLYGFANGGIIRGDGQLFIANEGGRAELIGGQDGSTVVVNNEQIIQSVIEGVRRGVMDAMEADRRLDDGGTTEIALYVDSEEIARAAAKGDRRINKRYNTSVQFA